MLKLSVRLLTPLLFIFVFALLSKGAHAAPQGTITPSSIDENTPFFIVEYTGLTPGVEYSVMHDRDGTSVEGILQNFTASAETFRTIAFCGLEADDRQEIRNTCSSSNYFVAEKSVKIYLALSSQQHDSDQALTSDSFTVARYTPGISLAPPTGFMPGNDVSAYIAGTRLDHSNPTRNNYQVLIHGENGTARPGNNEQCVVASPLGSGTINFADLPLGDYRIEVKEQINEGDCDGGLTYRTIRFTVRTEGGEITSEEGLESGTGRTPGYCESGDRCNPCPGGVCPTAIGDIPTGTKAFASRVLQIGTGLAGGLAFILMVIGAIRILVSQGDPQKLNGGREMMVAAIAGLLFLIFSVIILRFIGINIIEIGAPGS